MISAFGVDHGDYIQKSMFGGIGAAVKNTFQQAKNGARMKGAQVPGADPKDLSAAYRAGSWAQRNKKNLAIGGGGLAAGGAGTYAYKQYK